jgi:hypothetical protein
MEDLLEDFFVFKPFVCNKLSSIIHDRRICKKWYRLGKPKHESSHVSQLDNVPTSHINYLIS